MELRLARRAMTGSRFASGMASRMAGTPPRRPGANRPLVRVNGGALLLSATLRKPAPAGRLRCLPCWRETFGGSLSWAVFIWAWANLRHATKNGSTKASAGMPPAIAGLMRPPVLCLGQSSSGLRFASQNHKSCRTTPPAWSARRNTCQSRSASLDIRYLPCLLIWHSKSLLHGRSCHRRGPGLIEKRRSGAAHALGHPGRPRASGEERGFRDSSSTLRSRHEKRRLAPSR